MTLSEIKNTLTRKKILLTKSLGQNFLHDRNQVFRILEAAALREHDRILEIGPGLGALTQFLLDGIREVLAIEKDKRLYVFLQQRFCDIPHLRLELADAMEYLQNHKADWTDWKLVSNLPYSVASPLLVEMAESKGVPERMVVTIQTEVADRIVATSGQGPYGVLSLLIQVRYQPQGVFKIPRDCFFPVPEVDSSCLVLGRRPVPLVEPEYYPVFKKIVKRAFSQRRKMMMKLLKGDWPLDDLRQAFDGLGLSPQVRAERVSAEQFVQLTKQLLGASLKR